MEFFTVLSIGVVALVILAIVRSIKLHDKVRTLEWQILHLNSLADRMNKIEIAIEKLKPNKITEEQSTPSPVKPSVIDPETASRTSHVAPLANTAPEPSGSTSIHSAEKSRTREEWESFVGGKLLNRIGALALILGLGFFLKYAFDNNWISETVRVLIGAGAGLLCIGLAYSTSRKGFQIFAQGLVGAGIAILYLTVYASFNYYSLIPQWTAFVLMSLVTAFSLFLGMYFTSLAIGILGWAGGFLTPLMLSTGTANEIGLFTYIALLNVGLLAVVFAKHEWHILEPLALAGTWFMYFAWYFKYYHESDLILTVFFISLFWLLFFGLDIARFRFLNSSENTMHHSIAIANGALYYIMLYGLVNEYHHDWMGGITVFIGGIYYSVFLWLKHSRELDKNITIRFSLSAIILAVLATSIQFEGLTTVLFWSLEATALFWCGVRWDQRFLYFSATALLAAASMKFLATDGALAFLEIEHFIPLFNQRCLTVSSLTLAFGLCAWFAHKIETDGKRLASLLHPAWCIALFILCTIEINDFFRWKMSAQPMIVLERLRFARILILGLVWGFLSLPITWFALKNKLTSVLIPGICILAISYCVTAIGGFTFEPISEFQPMFNLRGGIILLVFIFLCIHLRMMAHQSIIEWMPNIIAGIQISLVILPLVLFSGETIDYFEQLITATLREQKELDRLNNLRQLFLSAIWLLYSVMLMILGFWRSLRGIRIMAFVLFGITILKIFIYDLSYLETLYRIISFMGLGFILLAVSYAYQRYKHIIFYQVDSDGVQQQP